MSLEKGPLLSIVVLVQFLILSRPGKKVPGQSAAVGGKERRARKAKHAEKKSDKGKHSRF